MVWLVGLTWSAAGWLGLFSELLCEWLWRNSLTAWTASVWTSLTSFSKAQKSLINKQAPRHWDHRIATGVSMMRFIVHIWHRIKCYVRNGNNRHWTWIPWVLVLQNSQNMFLNNVWSDNISTIQSHNISTVLFNVIPFLDSIAKNCFFGAERV